MPPYEVLVDFWCSHLRQRRFTQGPSIACAYLPESALMPDAAYERKVAHFLAKNELTRPRQLRVAEHPKEWLGAYEFSDDELEDVWNLRVVPPDLVE